MVIRVLRFDRFPYKRSNRVDKHFAAPARVQTRNELNRSFLYRARQIAVLNTGGFFVDMEVEVVI